ncbi:hypothetical protein VULLAG_LOCUS15628 [Vulpes lagopus]
MEPGGRGEERGRLGGPPSLLLPSCPPPTPQSLWPPWSPVRPAGGQAKAAGEGGGSRPGRAAELEREAAAAAAAGGEGGGRAGGRRRGEEEAETLHGNRISATNSIHHQKTPLGRGSGHAGEAAAGGGCGARGAPGAGRGPAASSGGEGGRASPGGPRRRRRRRRPAPSFLPPGPRR